MTDIVGDRPVSDLYRELQPQLVCIVASNLRAPDWVIDDACQIAWSSLIEHGRTVAAGGELGWLSTAATRAALRLLRRQRLTESYEQHPPAPMQATCAAVPAPERQLEVRERLAEIRRLPVRQQRVVMLHGFGYEYDEIAAVTGETRRTVARQLTRARQRLLRAADEA